MGAAVKPRNPNVPKQQPSNPNTKPSNNQPTNIKAMTTSAAMNAPIATVSPIRPDITPDTFDALPPVTPTFGMKQELRITRQEIEDMLDGKLINNKMAIVLLILLEYGTGVLYGDKFFTNVGDAYAFLDAHHKEDKKYQAEVFNLLTKQGSFNLKDMKLDAQLCLEFKNDD